MTAAYRYDWKDRWQDEGFWQKMKGRVRETWGELTDDEIDQAKGNLAQLVGTIKMKTGETAERVEERLEGITRDDGV
jgi:uncharacterized protein YjbJ (UPF0337 family)